MASLHRRLVRGRHVGVTAALLLIAALLLSLTPMAAPEPALADEAGLAALDLTIGDEAAAEDATPPAGVRPRPSSSPSWSALASPAEATAAPPSASPADPPSDPPTSSSPSPGPAPTPRPIPSFAPKRRLIDTAVVTPAQAFRSGTFRAAAYALPRLAWSALPYNGLGLPSTALSGPGLDGNGIAYKIVGGRRFYNPGTVAMVGCRYIDAYVRTGNPVYLDRAERRAARLRALSFRARGATWLGYAFDYPAEGLKAPWVSALAQGAGLSFFVRLYRATGSSADLGMARSLFLSFRMVGRVSRPWVDYVDGTGYLRLEEYPGAHPSHVFNGANFGYFGLYDYAMLTGDPTALLLARGHLTAMRRYAALYRVPGGLSRYDLVHSSRTVHYHAVNRWQLMMLGRMGGGAYFTSLYLLFLADSRAGTYP